MDAIEPGYICTETNTALGDDADGAKSISGRIPIGRWGVPEGFRGPVLFLAGVASRHVSGEDSNSGWGLRWGCMMRHNGRQSSCVA